MTNRATPGVPLELAGIQSSAVGGDTICLHLTGRWLHPAAASEEELLVVQVDGRRHRFPATRKRDPKHPQRWSASFRLPAWAEPRHDGQAALWLGSSVIPVPPPVAEPQPRPDGPAPGDPLAEVPRSGPLAELLLKEKVAALRAELAHRTAEATRLRAQLAELRTAHDERTGEAAALREQLSSIQSMVERELAEASRLREELAASTVARDAAVSELGGLRSQLDRLGAELAATRERVSAESGDLGQADRLLADARALAETLRSGPGRSPG